jgi:hypothetical protein
VTRGAAALAIAAALVAAATSACTMSKGTKEFVQDAATNLVTLRQGTITDLRARRGTGPFREYAVPPDEMVTIVEQVLKSKVVAVFPNRRAGEVIAKEREGDDAYDDWYSPKWKSAVVVIVHPVPEDPNRSKVEIHAMNAGKFDKGRIAWEAELPGLIDAAVARQGKPPLTPLK